MTTPAIAKARSKRPAPAPPKEPFSASSQELEVVLIRSARRTKSVSARLVNWYTLEVRAPERIPDDELRTIIDRLVARALKQRSAQRNFASDARLDERAQQLNKSHYGGELKWRSIRFVTNQNSCFGSCSPARGTIRISHRLAGVPSFVLDYVVMHELAHLLESNHSNAFWDLVYRFPKTERARGYLMALGMEGDLVSAQEQAEEGAVKP